MYSLFLAHKHHNSIYSNKCNVVECLIQIITICFLFLFSLITLWTHFSDCFYYNDNHWMFGICTIFLGWIHLLILGSNFREIGQNARIFIKILKNFIFVAIFGIFLIIPFNLLLRMVFYDPNEKVIYKTK